MKKRIYLFAVASLGLITASSYVLAAELDRDQSQDQLRTQDRIYGYQLMTQEERTQYRQRMRNATTAQERERIRMEHHKQMQERAKQRGITLPDMPSPRGMGGHMGTGGGMGPGGMGSGGGGR